MCLGDGATRGWEPGHQGQGRDDRQMSEAARLAVGPRDPAFARGPITVPAAVRAALDPPPLPFAALWVCPGLTSPLGPGASDLRAPVKSGPAHWGWFLLLQTQALTSRLEPPGSCPAWWGAGGELKPTVLTSPAQALPVWPCLSF